MLSSVTESSVEDSVIRWLHLTDLHMGKKDESQRTAMASLISAIEVAADTKPVDFVLLTGDLAFSGKSEEYEALAAELIIPLKNHPLCKAARFLATPGNHDMDCAFGWPPNWKDLGTPRQNAFFHLDETGQRTRAPRAGAFTAYRDFVIKHSIESVDPLDVPAVLITISGKKRNVAVIPVVTAYFADIYVPDNRRTTPAPIHPVRTLLQGLPEGTQPLVLGHHPLVWFTHDTEEQLHSLLVEHSALYLHGHEHKVRSRIGTRGLVSLGFGAGYVAPIDSSPNPQYRNSFAICELADSLHISVTSWDCDYGKWRSDQNLPGDFIDGSERLRDGYRLPMPTTRLSGRTSLASAIRNEVSIDRCIWLVDNDQPKRWASLLETIGDVRNVDEAYALPTQLLPAGHTQFRVMDGANSYLVYAISAEGDIFTYDQLQTINTELDKQSYTGCFVATLGELASEARTLATQLAQRKSITVRERAEIVRSAIRHLPSGLDRILLKANPSNVLACLVITSDGFCLLLQDRTMNAWFQVAGPDGVVFAESSKIVLVLRQKFPALRSIRYEAPSDEQRSLPLGGPADIPFDRGGYLSRSYEYFDDVKYAPLAALGMRFRKASLSDIYVQASADCGGASKSSQDLTRAVSEFIESLNLPQAQRDQLESQLRSRYAINRSAEVGAARKLYQRYNNVVVLGDPGSGKTCFVQYEILAYCKPPADDGSWYSHHLPMYVSLAEAARLLDDGTTLLDICEIVSSRRGIELPKAVVEKALSEGRAAFFFDGLDEVGYIDKRIALLTEIDDLVSNFASRGNRFVIASRPAAVQPVDIPEAMTYLQLKGLTEEEIRTLAGRVLTVRVGQHEEGDLTEDESDLIDRLVDDTKASPGIARIARNPLLLTLLVLIYANTGALSARRHVIYTQAIKTLVSVRGRQTREQQVSEADLRIRLGALALAIFQRNIAEIPKRSEVIEVLAPLMRPSKGRSPAEVAISFVQEVAEATGLLTIHSRDDHKSEDLVTFMHYSFLEYYAAAGLLTRDFMSLVPEYCGNARWKDVTTLLFGILSEQGDVTPLLAQILSDDTTPEAISKYKLLLALDCASECDVPPESSQDLLAAAVFATVADGAGRFSSDIRTEIAGRLEYFLQCAGQRLEDALSKGLRHHSALSAAAFADLVARIDDSVPLSKSIVAAFNECLRHEHAVTRAAALYAIEKRPELRHEEAQKVVQRSLKGSLIEKHAALKVIAAVPSFHDLVRQELRDLLDDSNALVSGFAAKCILGYGLKRRNWTEDGALLENVLAKLNQNVQDTELSLQGVTLDREIVRELIGDADANVSELAIRSLPLLKDNDQFVYQVLQPRIHNGSIPRHTAACLDAFRASPGAMDLITIADTDIICRLLGTGERNVRVAAARLLGQMPDDEQIVRSLQDHLRASANASGREEEVAECAKSLAKHVRRNQRLRDEVLGAVMEQLPRNSASGFGNEAHQVHILALLHICESIGGVGETPAVDRIYGICDDYRTPLAIRRGAIRAFGRIAEPSEKNIDRILRLLKHRDVRLYDSAYAAAAAFVEQCRRKVEYVRRVYSMLTKLRDRLCDIWEQEIRGGSESISPPALIDVRNAVVEIDNLMLAYEEFSGRAKIAN